MEFDWIDANFDLKALTPREIEESFEDPFAVKLLPEGGAFDEGESRYFCLGKAISGRSLISVFWTDGKKFRVILSRDMTDGEAAFFERKNAEAL